MALIPGKYLFSVTVSNDQLLYSTASAAVTLSSYKTPTSMVSTGKLKYSATEKVVVTAIINASEAALAVWSCVAISSADLREHSTNAIQAIISPGLSTLQLTIIPNFFSSGLHYTFQLQTCYNSHCEESVSYSRIQISINMPPTSGVLTVTPKYGLSLVTTFLLQTTSWVDDPSDYPLSYSMFYYSESISYPSMLQPQGPANFAYSVVGQGSSSLNYVINCYVNAFDSLSSYGVAYSRVTVQPYDGNMRLVTAMELALSTAYSEKNLFKVIQIMNSVLSSINEIECVVPQSCSTLNRQSCKYTPNTCGRCVDGYIGIPGDSNVECSSAENVFKTPP
jgi:hypothetical protein